MQLTKHTDYALRVLMFLARRTQRSTIHEIAQTHGISQSHLMKIVNRLAKLGYIESARGKGGGIRLARGAHEIGVGAVVRDTEETLNVLDCLDSDYRGGCTLARGCGLKDALRIAQRAFLAELDRYTLEDIVPEAGGVVRFVKPAAASVTDTV
jgi:Rrf2 family transcriptional regulator, nitric oxide-sensitive transcriptional repressor